MKYKWIELYGYAGIYNGMGLTQIKIDFTKCLTNKIIIRGSNGSGKSTLLNSIHPNPDTNDKFIKNQEARKNMCLLSDDGIEYIIRYIHPVTNNGRGTTKGYISKTINGQLVELNPNGNISSCKDILYNEFMLDSNFISLSKLSSEDRGLVDNKPAERKKLVNSIINTLEVYNNIYKILNRKSASIKHFIDSLTYKIDSIGDELKISAKLQNIENRLSSLEEEKNKTIEAIAAVKLKISEYMNILRDNNYDIIKNELRDISSHNKILRNKIIAKSKEFGIDDLNKLDSFLAYIDKKIILLESEISSKKSSVLSLIASRETEYKYLQNKQTKLDSLQSNYNYLDIKKARNDILETIKEYENIFEQMGIKNINLISKEEFDIAMESLKRLVDIVNSIRDKYYIEDIAYVIEHINERYINIDNLYSEINELKSQKSNLDTQITVYESKLDLISSLSNRPKNCKIDDCPYISSAINISSKYPKLFVDKLYSDRDSIEKEINNKEQLYNITKTRISIMNDLQVLLLELNSKMKYISKLPVRKDFKETFLIRIINMDNFSDIDRLYSFVDCGNMIKEYNLAIKQFNRYDSEYKIFEAKNEIIESIIDDINSLSKKLDDISNKITEINQLVSIDENELESLKSNKIKIENLLDKYKNDLIPSESKELELGKTKSILDTNSIEINKLQSDLEILISNQSSLNNDIRVLTEEKDRLKHSIILLNEYKVELSKYRENYDKIQKIKYYSSPSTGIQTLFMSIYMNKILAMANSLLSLLFDGEFMLQPFIINENEFRIPCIGSGLLHDDISSMSTAQKCMISMILGFSILQQSSTKYNIIMLDEIDGGLDTLNRSYFIELLDKLMFMLKSEQCFIISHNNELNTSACDLIILKNNSNEFFQGNVIWQY